jgi:hypothetical protein
MADLRVREFYFEKKDGTNIKDMTSDSDIFIFNPKNLGFTLNNTYVNTVGAARTMVKSLIADNKISFDLFCNSYETYQSFASEWFNSSDSFKFHYYQTDNDKLIKNYCLVDCASATITEKKVEHGGNAIIVTVSLNQLTLFGYDVILDLGFTVSPDEEAGGEIPIVMTSNGWVLNDGITLLSSTPVEIINNTGQTIAVDLYADNLPGTTFGFNIDNASPYEYYKSGGFYKSDGLSSVQSRGSFPQEILINGVKTYNYVDQKKLNYMMLVPGSNIVTFDGNGTDITLKYTVNRLF